MRVLKFTILVILIMICGAKGAAAQSAQPGRCVIAGRVMAGEMPVRDAMVIAIPADRRVNMSVQRFTDKFTFRMRTDAEGRFRIADLPSGVYLVGVLALALVNLDKDTESITDGPAGKRVALADNEVREDVNFTLARGGVITGRVTFADGRPVIAEPVRLKLETPKNMGGLFPRTDLPLTDDRGVYRIYGIPEGRYKVMVGIEGSGISSGRRKNEKYPQTYYPGVTDEATAQWIEIKDGNEVSDADIKIGAGEKAYTVAGKVVDADSGQGLGNFIISLNSTLKKPDGRVSSNMTNRGLTNSKGEFKLEGTVTGAYALSASEVTTARQYYSEVTRFEVKDANITDLEIKVHRGLTVSGAAVVEDTTDLAVIAERSQFFVIASFFQMPTDIENNFEINNSATAQVNADGSFSLSGIRPGQLRISAHSISQAGNLAFVGIERNGLDVSGGFEIKAGERVSDLRIKLALANCKIRGQVNVEGGTLDRNQHSLLSARRLSGNESDHSQARSYETELDPNGRFLLTGLIAGEYELIVNVKISSAEQADDKPFDRSAFHTTRQRVIVGSGQDVEVTLVVKAREEHD